MYDQPRSPPSAARFTSRPDSPSSQQRHDADSSQSTSNSFNVRTSSRNAGLHRASTVDVPHDKPQAQASVPTHPASDQGHARPSDLTLTQGYGSSSRPSSRGGPSSYTDESRLGSSYKSTNYSTSNVSQTSSNNSSPTTSNIQLCSACGLAMSGQFVRALGSVYHLDCFRCRDCNSVVAQKFFPIEGQDGKQYPLCERDYFKRLNLICGSCGMALRASYITACGKKYHVEHFTCSVCPTLFGPQDSYYEHEGNVYCHFHYSTRFATKCVGCGSAILKQFVEINRNSRDECWHPECYMIHKFWSVKLSNRRVDPPAGDLAQLPNSPWSQEEAEETADSLKAKQIKMEKQVYRIWTVLSAFEESSAACISDMLRHVSNGHYLEAVRMAEKFILHVEVLFATIDDLETHFARLRSKGMSHVREARMLCRKTVDLFTLLSHTQETGDKRVGMTQELLALVTGLAHYLKILIRIALTGALKLEREYNFDVGLSSFLDHLQALQSNKGNPSARRIKAEATPHSPEAGCPSTQGVSYGYKSLAPENAGETPFGPHALDGTAKPLAPPSDLCLECRQTVEEDCVRLGTYRRWHSACVKCKSCGKVATAPLPPKDPNPPPKEKDDEDKDSKPQSKLPSVRRAPALVDEFVFEPAPLREGATTTELAVAVIFCVDHGHAGCERGFQAVSRLEQYAFLLNVALRRLYLLLKRRGVIPMSAAAASAASQGIEQPGNETYRSSSELARLSISSSVGGLDRKHSATARIPKRSTIVESPSGRIVQTADTAHPHRVQGQADLHNQRQQVPTVANTPPTPSTPTLRQPQPRTAGNSTPLLQPRPPTSSPAGWQQNQGFSSPNSNMPDDFRPSFARNNTQVYIVDEQSAPTSPSQEHEESPTGLTPNDAVLTLADIPNLMTTVQGTEAGHPPPLDRGKIISELPPLELAIIKHAAVLGLTRSPLRDQFELDELLEMVNLKKGGWWGKIFKGDKKAAKKKGAGAVFGVPLEQLVERQGADCNFGFSQTTLRIPSIVDDLTSAMRQMDMSVEGIFRKNGNIRRLKDLSEAIDKDPQSVDLTQDNAVQLAALLKKFLRELPDPLLTMKLYKLLVASQMLPDPRDRKRCLHYLSIILPKPNRDTMEALFVFLKWVASFAHVDEESGSKMDLPNLATVICPNILYSSRNREGAHSDSVLAIPVVTELLVNQDEYWLVPQEFLPLLEEKAYFSTDEELSSKDFLKRVEYFMRVKLSRQQPPPNMGGGLMSPILPLNGNSNPFGTPRSENEIRLVQQTSDPSLGRGRPTANEPSRQGTPNQYKHDSRSQERGQQRDWQQSSPAKDGLPPRLPHQPYSQPLLNQSGSSPSTDQVLSDTVWAASQMPPPPITTGGRSRSGSRPQSLIRSSEEISPTTLNGRQSPSRQQ